MPRVMICVVLRQERNPSALTERGMSRGIAGEIAEGQAQAVGWVGIAR